MLRTLNGLSKPTVACVRGAAFGGGVGLVACCDIAVAAHDAIFSLSEAKLGLIPATISPYVIEAIGARQARRYFLTAERFTAAEAFRIGLVHDIVPEPELDARINEMLGDLLVAGPGRAARMQGADPGRRAPAHRRGRHRRDGRAHRRGPGVARRQGRRGRIPGQAAAQVGARRAAPGK